MILIILPVHNEKNNICSTAQTLFDFAKDNLEEFKIFFIDDGSTDGTADEIKKLTLPDVYVCRNQFDRGKGSALKTAYVLANIKYQLTNRDVIVFMDGDGQIRPREIKTFMKLMDLYDADIVVGNKRHIYSTTFYGFLRKIVSISYNFIIRILFGLNIQDTQCGLKVFKKMALDYVIENVTVKKYAFDLELLIALKETDLRIIDAPVYISKQLNTGSVSIGTIMQTFIDTLRIWIKKQKGFYRNG